MSRGFPEDFHIHVKGFVMPRPRAAAVVQCPVKVPAAWRERMEAAARLIDRPLTYWIDQSARFTLRDYDRASPKLQAALEEYAKTEPPVVTIHLELPVATVRGIRELCGRNKMGRFLRLAIGRRLGLTAG